MKTIFKRSYRNIAVILNKLELVELRLNCKGTILHIHTSAAVTVKVQWTLQIEALRLRGTSVVMVMQESVGAALSPSRIISLTPTVSTDCDWLPWTLVLL